MRKRHHMRRYIGLFSFIVLTAVLLLSTASCHAAHEIDPLAYLNEPFTAEVRGELGGIAFTGTLTRRSAANGGAEFCFTAPAALAGVTLRRTEETGEQSVSLGDIQIPTDGWASQDLFRLLLPLTRGRTISTYPNEDGSVTAVIETASGIAYTVTTDAGGIPRAWEGDGFFMRRTDP